MVIGDWLVTCHGDNNQINEKIVFDENNLNFYRNDFETPAVVSSYGWDGVDLVADKLQIKMRIHSDLGHSPDISQTCRFRGNGLKFHAD